MDESYISNDKKNKHNENYIVYDSINMKFTTSKTNLW